MPWPSKSTVMLTRDRAALKGLNRDIHAGSDWSVDAVDGPVRRRVHLGDHRGRGPVCAADTADHRAV